MLSTTMTERLAAIKQLPTLPLVVRQVQKIIKNPKTSMEQIAAVIAKDQVLAARVIRLVNSAFYGLPKRMSAVSQAILVLGLNTVNNILMSVSIVNVFRTDTASDFDHEAFWEHAFGCACIARGIAKQINFAEPEDCFTAGLVHDIGRLVLEQYFHQEFMKALKQSRSRKTPLLDEEIAVFGAGHDEVGALLCEKWNLPAQIISALRYHHQPSDPESGALTRIIAHAAQLTQAAGIGNSFDNEAVRPNAIIELPGNPLSQTRIDAIINQARIDVSQTIQEYHQ
jgi:putative nucleotidyltransferase with HDIG domain